MQKNPSSFLPGKAAILAGGACTALGATVLVGWHTHTIALLIIHRGFVAMAYNTALGFSLCGIGLLLAGLGRSRLAVAPACGAVVLGVITLLEYMSGRTFGVDGFFMNAYIRAGIVYFNRMACCTALCFLLAGIALLLVACFSRRAWLPPVTSLLGSLIAGLGTIGLSGYVTGIAVSYTWGLFTRMAVHTSVGFMVLGVGLICLADCLSYEGRLRTPRWLPIPVGVGVLTVALCLWQAVVVQDQAIDSSIRRLALLAGQAAPNTLTRGQQLIPLGVLLAGFAMSALIALAIHLAQTAQMRAAEAESANEALSRQIAERERIEQALRQAQEELETRVIERTADLAQTNEQLQEEVIERERAEKLLIEHQQEITKQRAFLRQVIDTAPAFIFVKDTEGRFLLVNQALADIAGYTVEEMIGKHTTDVLPEEVAAPLLENDQEVIATGKDCVLDEQKIVTKSGHTRWIQMVKRRLVSPDGTVSVLCIATDITERKSLHSQVVQAEKLAALGELVAGVAHEINNPLTAIIGNAELLEMHPDEQVREDAKTIVGMGQRAVRIVRSLLTFSRGTGGERRMESLNALVHGTLEMATYKLRKTNVALELRLDEELPTVLVNANEIQQVILNLINNAEHALRKNPGERKLTITTSLEGPNGERYAALRVEDNGHGIPDDVVGSIFDPFFTTKGVGEGTGLGLSICHGIAEAHGGKLSVQSSEGAGAAFTLLIPLDNATKEEPAKAA